MIPLLLLAILATDVAVAVMYFTLRRSSSEPVSAASLDASLAGEMEELVQDLRNQAEQAAAELARQKAHLRRMLADVERRQAEVSVAPPAARPAALAATPARTPSRRDILRLAGEGLPLRSIAARTGLSVEEVRLMLAMAEEAA